jgi:hypothetical protein
LKAIVAIIRSLANKSMKEEILAMMLSKARYQWAETTVTITTCQGNSYSIV